jgi:hypothetical protein
MGLPLHCPSTTESTRQNDAIMLHEGRRGPIDRLQYLQTLLRNSESNNQAAPAPNAGIF